ncbi:alpha/beta hydrolase [bacterium]|nr:alpha/beta hydrolase [bacterium]
MQLSISGRTVDIFSSAEGIAPLVILNTIQEEGAKIFEKCTDIGCKNFTLAAISGLNWNRDLSPWETPEIRNNRYSFGGADEYISQLTTQIMPEILSKLPEKPEFTALAGYSLAGLFALYAAYRTDVFSRVASVSGSLWFPGFTEFAQSHDFVKTPDLIYLSLGDAEAKKRDKNLAPVQKNTELLTDFYKSHGIPTIFEINCGNHFADTIGRTAKGIVKLVKNKSLGCTK